MSAQLIQLPRRRTISIKAHCSTTVPESLEVIEDTPNFCYSEDFPRRSTKSFNSVDQDELELKLASVDGNNSVDQCVITHINRPVLISLDRFRRKF